MSTADLTHPPAPADRARPGPLDSSISLAGQLHVFVAFDWGEEVDLEKARGLVPAEVRVLTRRSRTPSSIGYKPAPLRFRLDPLRLALPEVPEEAPWVVEATVFDFAAVSAALRVPLDLPPARIAALAGRLSEPETEDALVRAARSVLTPLYEKILPAIDRPLWHDLWEEYIVFRFPPGKPLTPSQLLDGEAGWLAGLLRLEDQPLSDEEVAEALRLPIRYGRHDLFIPDWAAAVLLDEDSECEETLQAVEFANLQLLEYRHIDDRLDVILARTSQLLHQTARRRLPLWRTYVHPLRELGELNVEANGLFERTGNVLKLIGDQYLARVYRLLAARFHLEEWERSIRRKLEVIEGAYEVVSDQTGQFRMEFLEFLIVVLILWEIVFAFFRP